MQTHTDYEGCNLRRATFFDYRNLHGANMRRVWGEGVSFSDCDLVGTDFTGAFLTGARFEYCDLREAIFTEATLREAQFVGCTWRGTELADAWLDDTTILSRNRFVSLEEEARLVALSQQDTQAGPTDPQPIVLGQHLAYTQQQHEQQKEGVKRLFSMRETAYVPSRIEKLLRGKRAQT